MTRINRTRLAPSLSQAKKTGLDASSLADVTPGQQGRLSVHLTHRLCRCALPVSPVVIPHPFIARQRARFGTRMDGVDSGRCCPRAEL